MTATNDSIELLKGGDELLCCHGAIATSDGVIRMNHDSTILTLYQLNVAESTEHLKII